MCAYSPKKPIEERVAQEMERAERENQVIRNSNYRAAWNEIYPDSVGDAQDIVDKVFTYQTPNPDQLNHIQDVREGFKSLARTIIRHVPVGADRTAAIRKLREAMMTANAAIVLNGLNI